MRCFQLVHWINQELNCKQLCPHTNLLPRIRILAFYFFFFWGLCCFKILCISSVDKEGRRQMGCWDQGVSCYMDRYKAQWNVKFKSRVDKTLIPELTQMAKGRPFALHQLSSGLSLHLEKPDRWDFSEHMLHSYFYIWNVPLYLLFSK